MTAKRESPDRGYGRGSATHQAQTKATTDRPDYNGTPPANMTDPVIRRRPVERAAWSRALRGRVPLKQAGLARALADYGNKDGSNCHPGMNRLIEDLMSSKGTLTPLMNWLVEYGWLMLTKRGSTKLSEASVWQLTLPLPVAIELGLTDQAEPLWAERPGWMDRSKFTPKDPGGRKARREREVAASASDLGSDGRTLTEFLGSTDALLGSTNDVQGSDGRTSPGPTSPGPSSHHSDAVASGSPHSGEPIAYNPDEWDYPEDYVSHVVGGFQAGEESTALGMLERDRPPRAIVNRIRADRREVAA